MVLTRNCKRIAPDQPHPIKIQENDVPQED